MSYFKKGKKPSPSFSEKPAKKVVKCKFHAKHQRNCVDCEKQ